MPDDYIVQHQDLQPEDYLVMVRGMYMRMGFGPLPDPTEDNSSGEAVSYTHLTLPTILRV